MRVQVWAWRCELTGCNHTWLAVGLLAPEKCAKCKRRNWHTKDVAPVEAVQSDPHTFIPVTNAARIAALIPGVRLGMGPATAAEVIQEAEPERRQCLYKEYVGDIGEWMRCGLNEHGPKTRHGNWQQV